MPSNHDSQADSDNESLSNELSPTDGYFNQRPLHPQDVLVPDPIQQSAESDKAREAREESQSARASHASAASPQSPQRSPQLTSPRRRVDPVFEEERIHNTENTPLIDSAPPTYTDATAGSGRPPSRFRHHTSRGSIDSGYHYNTMGRGEIFLPNREPEDLGGEALLSNYNNGHAESWREKVQRLLSEHLGRWRRYLVLILSLALLIWVFVKFSMATHRHGDSDKNPVKSDPGKDDSGNPFSCPTGVHTENWVFDYTKPPTFEFIEFPKGHDNGDPEALVHTGGEIHIRPAPKMSEPSLRLEIEMLYSDDSIRRGTEYKVAPEFLHLYTPNHVPLDSETTSWPCMYTTVTLWIAPETCLDDLIIQTQSMKVIFHDELSLKIENTLRVVALFGDIVGGDYETWNVNSRHVVIQTTSGSIHGSFPLYDVLQITSQTGSITVAVEPKAEDKDSPAPARLAVESTSGTINIRTPLLTSHNGENIASKIPERDYCTSIEADSGSIDVALIQGIETHLRTQSGSIQAELSPFGSSETRSDIFTDAKTGSSEITVHSSITDPGKPLRKFFGSYSYMTGSLKITYPAEWEGKLSGKTLSGSINLKWPGMRIITDGRDTGHYAYRHLRAVKGHGAGTLKFEGVSGSVDLKGGDNGNHTENENEWEDEPEHEDPDMGGAPPPRWPGYEDEWDFNEGA